jgi:predicted phosphodiesterase
VRIAIVSDIHANATAFEAVLAHAKAIGYDQMVCLGDVIGYGPDPVECIDLVRRHCEWTLLGNHDFASIYEPTNFNAVAARAVFWTRAEAFEGGWLKRRLAALEAARDAGELGPDAFAESRDAELRADRERDDFMHSIYPRRTLLGRYVCVHASPSRPVNEYLFSADVLQGERKLKRNFDLLQLPVRDEAGLAIVEDDGRPRMRRASAIVGHTHCPGFILELGRDPLAGDDEAAPADGRYEWEPFDTGVSEWSPGDAELPPGSRFILNPGSVGQPRDGDPRSSYVMLDVGEGEAQDRFTFHRVEYDVSATQARLKALQAAGAPLNDWLWERLEKGQ